MTEVSCCIYRYISKHRPAVLLEHKATKDAMRTMGPAKVEVPLPDKFLKKHSKEPKLPESEFSCRVFDQRVGAILLRDCHLRSYLPYVLLETQDSKEARKSFTVRKPAVPARTDNPIMGLQTKRDFIKTTTAVTMKPKPTSVDSRNGHKQLLENSGLVPKYIKKKVFLSTTLHTKKNGDIFCLTVAYVWEHIPPLYWSIPGPWL